MKKIAKLLCLCFIFTFIYSKVTNKKISLTSFFSSFIETQTEEVMNYLDDYKPTWFKDDIVYVYNEDELIEKSFNNEDILDITNDYIFTKKENIIKVYRDNFIFEIEGDYIESTIIDDNLIIVLKNTFINEDSNEVIYPKYNGVITGEINSNFYQIEKTYDYGITLFSYNINSNSIKYQTYFGKSKNVIISNTIFLLYETDIYEFDFIDSNFKCINHYKK